MDFTNHNKTLSVNNVLIKDSGAEADCLIPNLCTINTDNGEFTLYESVHVEVMQFILANWKPALNFLEQFGDNVFTEKELWARVQQIPKSD